MTERVSNRSRLTRFMRTNEVLIGISVIIVIVAFVGASTIAKHNSQQSKCDAAECVSLSRQPSQPEVFTVTSGSYIKFSSADGQKHNMALIHSGIQHEDKSRYESGDFNADEAWKVQFKQDGTYTFEDKYNENAEISVIVYTPGKKYEIK